MSEAAKYQLAIEMQVKRAFKSRKDSNRAIIGKAVTGARPRKTRGPEE